GGSSPPPKPGPPLSPTEGGHLPLPEHTGQSFETVTPWRVVRVVPPVESERSREQRRDGRAAIRAGGVRRAAGPCAAVGRCGHRPAAGRAGARSTRSEEHTAERPARGQPVCPLLLDKKKTKTHTQEHT